MTLTGWTAPWNLFALTALLLLVLLYLFQRHARQQRTATLFLWDRPEAPPRSGARRHFRRFPPEFYLEALALALLAAAAAGPFFTAREEYPPLAVILDNSFSMRTAAGNGETFRTLALPELRRRLEELPGRRIFWFAAGRAPRLLADDRNRFDFERAWTATEDAADLTAALALVRRTVPDAEILVITDAPPPEALRNAAEIGWISAGQSRPNLAIVNARRGDGRLLVEVVNYAAVPVPARLTLTPGNAAHPLTLDPGERRKIVFRLTPEQEETRLQLQLSGETDALDFDNERTLLPEDHSPVLVRIQSGLSDAARRDLEAVLTAATGFRQALTAELEILPPGQPSDAHRLIWHQPVPGRSRPTLTDEPIILSPDHALTRGLSPDELHWTAVPDLRLPGETLISRGADPVLTALRRLDGKWDFHLNLQPESSNLARRPLWPALFWNLAALIRAERPGAESRNLRSGELVRLRLPFLKTDSLRLILPDGTEEILPARNGRSAFPAPPPGISRIEAENFREEIAVSSGNPAESDLRRCAPFLRDGTPPAHRNRHAVHSWSPLLLLAALLVLALHQIFIGKRREEPL